ncbi:hypothetical protein LSH36_102g02063 [Paralvinella palmiformis]|uniref:Craniofacial development protein 1 n=1 Tax=Paralvinella palmiformis TaxID=53620 RepID=A0AAD9JZL0_9ANNE|nr:hypothetical protein LSH36_102g02063 [Paralvinella palmiformis]
MNADEEFSSDTSDDDYVPIAGEAVSEEDGSGDNEEVLGGEQEDTNKSATSLQPKGKRKRMRTKSDFNSRKRKVWLKADEDSDKVDNIPAFEEKEEVKEDPKEKKKADDLWADFMKDVGQSKPKPVPSSGVGALSSLAKVQSVAAAKMATSITSPKSCQQSSDKKPEKVTITKEYDFAGEVVKITKEVDADCKEAKEAIEKQDCPEESKSLAGPSVPVLKKSGGGLGNVLGKIGKKLKISTLEKSKLDWNNFKKKEGISDELQIHNRGKDGYIERMSFLERTDHRQFEIERSLRMSSGKR